MSARTKLELTWIGKENRPKLERSTHARCSPSVRVCQTTWKPASVRTTASSRALMATMSEAS